MRKRLIFGLTAAAVVVGSLVVLRHEIAGFAIVTAARIATGYDVTIGDQRIGFDGASFSDVRASRNGVPLISLRRLDIRYSLRDLLPGSKRRFGLAGIDLLGAEVTVERFPDGGFNFTPPSPAPQLVATPQRPSVNPVPWRFTVSVKDSSLQLREPSAYDRVARDIKVEDFNGNADVDSAHRTHYSSKAAFHTEPPEPFTIAGTIDAVRGFAMHRARARRFPLRALANYFTDTAAVRILGGHARDLDARLYSLEVEPNVAPSYHANLKVDIDDASMALATLDAPIKSVRGRLQLVDSTVFLRHMHATLTGIKLHLAGGIYDLLGTASGQPQLRLGIYGSGDLASLRHAFAFTRTQPIAGATDLGVLVEGPLVNPTIVASANAPRASYRGVGFDALHAGVVYRDGVVGLLPLRAYYRGTEIDVRGAMTVGKALQSDLAVHIAGSADQMPYLDELLGREPILADAVATGDNTNFNLTGAAASARGVSRVAALFTLHPNGTAAIEPFWLHTQRGSFDGAYLLDRPHATSAFWALASGLRMKAPADAAFPGLGIPAIPPITGRIERVAVAGGGPGTNVLLAGELAAHDTSIAGLGFYRIAAAFGGSLADAQIGLLHASGPWGRFDGNGAFSSQALVAAGTYRGTLEGLQPFLTNAIPAHGPVAGHTAISVASNRIVVQASDLAMPGATLRGIPVSQASLTLAVEPKQLRVYSARALAAGGSVVAAGTFSLANASGTASGSDALALIANRLDAAQLHGLGLPLDAGRIWAVGNLAAGAPLPSFDGGVTLADGSAQHFPISGGGEVRLAGQTAKLQHVVGSLGPTYALVGGSIGALASGSPAYALRATVPAAPVAATLRALHFPTYPADGTFNAQLELGGRGADPSVAGRVNVPSGEVNGLPFIDGGAVLAADTRGASANDGHVRVATTAVRFDAVSHGQETSVHVSAPQTTLADFNNFFDTGDTLAGSGSLKFFAALHHGERLSTDGAIDIRGLRYRNLPFGHTTAAWSNAGNDVTGSLSIGGPQGILRASGSIGFVPAPDLRATLTRSRYDLSGSIANLDLSLWLPALGLTNVPITGFGAGSAAVRGTFPQLNLHGDAAIAEGTFGPIHLDTAKISLRSVGSRIAVQSADVAAPGLTATATGSFGIRPQDPLDVQVHAATDDLPRLVHQFARVTIPVTGAFESTLRIGGTLNAPTFVAGLDATGVKAYGIAIPSLFGKVQLHGKTLVLSDAGATFEKGEATLAGFVPLTLSPIGLGAAGQPVSFDADVVDLNPAIFDEALGNHTKLGGNINGHFGLAGTIGHPLIVGHAMLDKGSYVSDLQRSPITNATARLRFDHTSATIDDVYARLGGTVTGSGRIEFPNGFGAGSGYSFVAKGLAKGARLDFPAFGNGTFDADLALTKTPVSKSLLSGKVTLSAATLALSAFLSAAGNSASTLPPLPLAFDLHATAGRGVRVRGRGYGAALDVGLAGALHLQGTLAAPQLAGSITSTGGTVTYFDRAFRVQEGTVTFDGSGVTPTIHAVATTSIFMPDAGGSRNGSVAVTVTAQGQVDSMDIEFATNPPGFSTEQTLAMLAPFGGFINLGTSGQQLGQVQTPGGFTPLGATQPLPTSVYRTGNSSVTIGREAFNILNARFSSALLGPLENALGEGLGLSSVNLTLGYYGEVGLTASRLLGDNFTAVYSASFGIPQVHSFGMRYNPSPYTSATLSFFYQTGPTRVLEQPVFTVGSSDQLLLGQPLFGTTGFNFLLQRYL